MVAAAERPGCGVEEWAPDLAGSAVARVRAPTVLIVGDYDYEVIKMNREALEQFRAKNDWEMYRRNPCFSQFRKAYCGNQEWIK